MEGRGLRLASLIDRALVDGETPAASALEDSALAWVRQTGTGRNGECWALHPVGVTRIAKAAFARRFDLLIEEEEKSPKLLDLNLVKIDKRVIATRKNKKFLRCNSSNKNWIIIFK